MSSICLLGVQVAVEEEWTVLEMIMTHFERKGRA